MKNDIRAILDDLYALDPSLHSKESELVPLLVSLLKVKPDAAVDEEFLANLRSRLITTPERATAQPMRMRILAFSAAFAVLTLVVAVPLAKYNAHPGGTPAITTLAAGAFGELGATQAAGGLGGGGDATRSATFGTTEDAKMIAPGEPYPSYSSYAYVYDGSLTLPGDVATVYKRNLGLTIPENTKSMLGSMDLGVLDLGAFGGLTPQYITLKQADTNGYSISLDLQYGTVYMSINEGYWANHDFSQPLAASDIPGDAAVLEIAKNFLTKYDISTDGYGEPIVNDVQLAYALRMAESGASYTPDYVSVSWPMLVDGMPVIGTDGSGYGITVTVSLRTGDVTNASIYSSSSIDASEYALETDTTKIMDVVNRGGLWSWQPTDAQNTYRVTLGEPELVLTTHSNYDSTTGRSTELFVPALRFVVTQNAGDNQQSAVIVPLVREILDSAAEQPIYHILDTVAADNVAVDAEVKE